MISGRLFCVVCGGGFSRPFGTVPAGLCDLLLRVWRGIVDDAVHGSSGDAVLSCDLAQALTEPAITKDGFPVEVEWTTTDGAAFKFGPAHAGPDPFDN